MVNVYSTAEHSAAVEALAALEVSEGSTDRA
jgi:hypothetical protein